MKAPKERTTSAEIRNPIKYDGQRKNFWLKTTGAMYEMSYNSLYYSRILEENKHRVSKFTSQIDTDLHRTFPEEDFFNQPSSFSMLKNILTAYSFRNPNIGYCQGMNFLAGRFLTLGFSEVESFWLLVQLVERYLPFEYYTTMTGVLIDQKVFDYLLKTRLNDVFTHFESLEIDSSLITVQWFTCVFANNFSPEVIARLWDELFLNGHGTVYKIALSIFWLSKQEILAKNELSEICKSIDKCCKNINAENLISTMNKKVFKNHPSLLENLKEISFKEVNKEIISRFPIILTAEQVMEKIENCENEEFCRQINLETSMFFTFMADSCVNVIDQYLDNSNYTQTVDLSLVRESAYLMMGKKNHHCQVEINEEERRNQFTLS